MSAEQKRKIIFVCTGNTCRSPMAEAICRSELKRLRAEDVEVYSAGISVKKGGTLNANSAIVLSENGLSLENFNSTPLTDEAVLGAYAVVCMTQSQSAFLKENSALAFFKNVGKCASLGENIHSFYSLVGYEIPDPFGMDLNCYRATFERIARAMPELLEKLGVKAKPVEQAQPTKRESFLDLGDSSKSSESAVAPKKRGRPRKNPPKSAEGSAVAPKKRGRPKKKQE